MRWRKRIPALIIYIMFTVGVIGHSISHTLDLMVFLTPFFLLGMGIFVIHSDILGKNHKFLIFLIITYVITFSIEALGVETGLVFGDYVYGTTLGFHVIGVPLVIGFNWVLVVVGSVKVAKKITGNNIFAAILGGSISTTFDYFLEPVAIKMDYWTWAGGDIPIQNYVAWFVIATVFSYIFLKFTVRTRSDLPIHYLFVQSIFFLILQIVFFF